LGKDSAADLKKKLKNMGYSEKAAEEILKWYENNVPHADEDRERSLRSGNLRQKKRSR
jgi:hypothetical protein